ncbi:class A sortase [Companilactobacillus sp. RD055328]|nr:class A sortase [Companilactobacillus sp. RD055328]
MKKFFKRFLVSILMIIGLVLIFNQQIMEFIVGQLSENQIEQVTKSNIKEGKASKGDFDFEDVKPFSPTEVGKGMTNNYGFPVLGQLEVPSVGVKLPIGKGVSTSVLNKGAGTMKPDQQMGEGNYSLAGHHVRGRYILFSPLVDVKIGASIYLTDLDHVYKYKIYSKEVIQPSDVKTIDDVEGKKIVTLITCADLGTKRWAIKGELVDTKYATKKNLNELKNKKVTTNTRTKEKTNSNYLFIMGVIVLVVITILLLRSLVKKSKKK